MIRVIAKLNPFDKDVVYCDIDPGLSLTEIVGQKNEKIHAQVEGVPVPLEAWDDTFPRHGEIVTLTIVPQFFGIDIAAAVAAAASAGASAGAAVGATLGLSIGATAGLAAVGATIGGLGAIAGMLAPMLLPMLIRPQIPSMGTGGGYAGGLNGRFNMLNQQSNPAMQYGVIPKLYGEFRITPPLAGNTYTRIANAAYIGNSDDVGGPDPVIVGREPTQFITMLLCLGYGPLKVGKFIVGQPGTGTGSGSFKTLVGNNYVVSGENLDPTQTDATCILVGDTPIGAVKGAKYRIGLASTVIQNFGGNNSPIYTKDIEEDHLSFSLPTINIPPDQGSSYTSWDHQYYVNTSTPNPLKIEVDIIFNSLYAARMKDDKTGTQDVPVNVVFLIMCKRSSEAGTLVLGSDAQGNPQIQGNGAWQSYQGFSTGPLAVKHPLAWTVGLKIVHSTDELGNQYDRSGVKIAVGETFDVAVIRVSTTYAGPHILNSSADASWVAMRSIKAGKVWDVSVDNGLPEAILMAVEFQATGQLNGTVDPISIKAQSVLKRPIADTVAAWGSNQELKWEDTSSPAWAFADVFLGSQLQKPMLKAQIDWPALIKWSNWCDGTTNKEPDGTAKLTRYNWYHADEETMLDRIRTITSCGRATWAITNGLFSVLQDTDFYPVQLISPRNSSGFELVKSYPRIPHALRVRFVHPKTWQQDEVIVLDDYYLIDGKDNWGATHTPGQGGYKKASIFEVMETQGVTNKKQAMREGRYHLANMRLRNEVFSCTVDFENLVAQRGDCVLLSHDVLLRGRAFGRITKINPPEGNGGYTLDLDTDFEISTDAPSFALQVRSLNSDLASSAPLEFVEIPLSNPPGVYSQAWVSTSHADLIAKIAEQDLFVFGPYDDEGRPTGSLLAKITQVDYQPDMSAKLTMVYAAPGIPAADDGIMDDDGDGPEVPPELQAPPVPIFPPLILSSEIPELSEDGPRFTVFATWTIPQGIGGKTDYVEVWYHIGATEYQWVEVLAGAGRHAIPKIPPETQITAKLRGKNSIKYSEFTAEQTLVTPLESELLPRMPTNLQLEQRDYRQGNGRILYFIQVSWTVEGLTGGTLVEWIKEIDIAENSDWPADKKSAKFVSGGDQFFEIEGVTVAIYHIRVASQSIIRNDQYSAWNEGSLEVLVYDYPPGPPTNLRATSTVSGVKLEWDNPLDGDWVGIEIWRNNANDRDGRVELPVIPPAEMIHVVPNTGTGTGTYFDALDDSVWHWYWIRSFDSENGIIPTNWSTWERPDPNDGVRGRAGIHGDGVPPPPPINLVLTPDTWEIGLHWEQSQEIPDLFGTQIFFSETNDRGPDEALLATYLATSQNNYGTHTRLETGKTYYYWIRNIDVENLVSTWLPEDRYGGATATVPPDPWKYLQLLNGAITETQLAQSLLGLINSQGLETNQTFLALETLVTQLAARVVLRIQQNYGGLVEVAGIGFGSEIQNEQTISQFLVQADRFAVGSPQVFNSAGVELSPIQYDENGDRPTVYDIAGNVITPYGYDGQPLPDHMNRVGLVRHVYDASGNRMPIYTEDHKIWPAPRWDTFIVTTEEYIDADGNFIPPGVYIRDANIAEGSIHGRKIKAGTITADLIDTTGLVIRDADGNEIFGANVELNFEKMFGADAAEIIRNLKSKDIHLYIKNGVIGDLYIADTLSSIDYTPWSVDLNGEPIPGTGWLIQRGSANTGEPSVIETDNLIARGELSSEIYYPGVAGWKLFRDGSCELNNGVFRGTLGAETLLVGSDFSLGQLSEQIMLASLNIMVTNQYFSFTEAGADFGDETITMFANNLDNVLWTAKAYPGEVVVDLATPVGKPRYRQLTIDKMRNGAGFYDYIAVTAQFQDRFDQVKIFPLRDASGIVTAELSNARINLAADSRGYVGNYTKAVGIFRVYLGKTVVAKSALAYSVVSTTNCSAEIVNDPAKANHGYYQVSAVTKPTASVTLRVTYNGVHYDRQIGIFVYQAVLSGAPGDPGDNGIDGKRGSKFFAFYSYDPGGFTEASWTENVPGTSINLVDSMVKTDPGSEGVVVDWDVVTLINYTTGWSQTRMKRATGWEIIVAFFNGDVLVHGTVYARHIVASGITISSGVSSKTSKTIGVGVESSSVANFLSDVTIAQYDTLESVLLFANFAIWTPAGGEDTAVSIFFKVSEDGGETWDALGSQGYGVPGTAFRILLSYSYQMKIGPQVFDPAKPPRQYRVTVKVPSGEGGAVVVQDRSFTVLGAYR